MKKFFNDKDDDTASRFFPGLVFSSTTPHQYWSQGITLVLMSCFEEEEEFFFCNTRNRFEHPTPRSISITEGRRVEVSYNLLDVSEVLKVEFYSLKLHYNLYESVT